MKRNVDKTIEAYKKLAYSQKSKSCCDFYVSDGCGIFDRVAERLGLNHRSKELRDYMQGMMMEGIFEAMEFGFVIGYRAAKKEGRK